MDAGAAVVFGAAVMVTGLGSIAFHAWMTEWGGWADLVGAAGLLIYVVGCRALSLDTRRLVGAIGVITGVTAILLWFAGTANGKYLLYPWAAAAVLAEVKASSRTGVERDRRWLAVALVLFIGGAAIWWQSRTGFPLCSADSFWQWHGMWHILVSGALVALFAYWRSEVALDEDC